MSTNSHILLLLTVSSFIATLQSVRVYDYGIACILASVHITLTVITTIAVLRRTTWVVILAAFIVGCDNLTIWAAYLSGLSMAVIAAPLLQDVSRPVRQTILTALVVVVTWKHAHASWLEKLYDALL